MIPLFRLVAVVLLLPLPALAQDTVSIGGLTKRAVGTLVAFESGDIACYVTLEDDHGARFREMADFDLCAQERALRGKRVALTYRTTRVQAASCQGNPECKTSDTVVLVVAASPAPQASFCTPAETIVFNCRTGLKLVSVCASKDAARNQGYVQYRFGKAHSSEPLEMTLPESRVVPPRAASGATVAFSGGGGAWLRFGKGPFAYAVYTGVGNWGRRGEKLEKAGVLVERDGKQVANLKCTTPPTSLLGPDWFAKVGIEPMDQEFDFPD